MSAYCRTANENDNTVLKCSALKIHGMRMGTVRRMNRSDWVGIG